MTRLIRNMMDRVLHGGILALPQIGLATILTSPCFLETGVHYGSIVPFFVEIVLCLFTTVWRGPVNRFAFLLVVLLRTPVASLVLNLFSHFEPVFRRFNSLICILFIDSLLLVGIEKTGIHIILVVAALRHGFTHSIAPFHWTTARPTHGIGFFS